MIRVVYDEGPPEVHLPDSGITVPRGVPTEVPDDVAGRAPGKWRRAKPEEMTPGGGWTPSGWPLRDEQRHDEQGPVWSTRDPGSGLLAQDTVWRKASAADSTPKEG